MPHAVGWIRLPGSRSEWTFSDASHPARRLVRRAPPDGIADQCAVLQNQIGHVASSLARARWDARPEMHSIERCWARRHDLFIKSSPLSRHSMLPNQLPRRPQLADLREAQRMPCPESSYHGSTGKRGCSRILLCKQGRSAEPNQSSCLVLRHWGPSTSIHAHVRPHFCTTCLDQRETERRSRFDSCDGNDAVRSMLIWGHLWPRDFRKKEFDSKPACQFTSGLLFSNEGLILAARPYSNTPVATAADLVGRPVSSTSREYARFCMAPPRCLLHRSTRSTPMDERGMRHAELGRVSGVIRGPVDESAY